MFTGLEPPKTKDPSDQCGSHENIGELQATSFSLLRLQLFGLQHFGLKLSRILLYPLLIFDLKPPTPRRRSQKELRKAQTRSVLLTRKKC